MQKKNWTRTKNASWRVNGTNTSLDKTVHLLLIPHPLPYLPASVTMQQKFGDGAGPMRSLEDEGFFVGKKPIIPMKLIQRAEQRIIQEHEHEKKVRLEILLSIFFFIVGLDFSRPTVGSRPMEVSLLFPIRRNSFPRAP